MAQWIRRWWRQRPGRARGVSALGIPILEPVELGDVEAASDPPVELALDLEALLLAHDPAEARTTAVSAHDLSALSAQRRSR